MAVTSKKYGQADLHAYSGRINFLTDTIKCLLTTNAHVPDQDTHDYRDDITNEITGTGYTAGGATLGGKTLTYTAGSNTVAADANDVSLTGTTLTFRNYHVYKDTGTASTSPLIAYGTNDSDVATVNGALTIAWDATGLFYNTAA